MKVNKTIVLITALVVLSAVVALSQIAAIGTDVPEVFSDSKVASINDRISLEEKQDCTISFFNSTKDIFANVKRARPTFGTCFNTINQSYNGCINGTELYQSYEVIGTMPIVANTTNCITKSFVVSVDTSSGTEKKEIDFYGWGVCIKEIEGNCVAIICGTLSGGSAWNGVFNGCDGGKSCQKFLFCKDETKVLYKAAREDFTEEDPTFHLTKLEMKGVGR